MSIKGFKLNDRVVQIPLGNKKGIVVDIDDKKKRVGVRHPDDVTVWFWEPGDLALESPKVRP